VDKRGFDMGKKNKVEGKIDSVERGNTGK